MSGRDFEAYVSHYANLTSSIVAGAVDIARESERNLASASENEVDSILLSLKEQFSKSLSGLVVLNNLLPISHHRSFGHFHHCWEHEICPV